MQTTEGGDGKDAGSDEQQEKKRKENIAYAKKVVLRLAGLMGAGSGLAIIYVFGKSRLYRLR